MNSYKNPTKIVPASLRSPPVAACARAPSSRLHLNDGDGSMVEVTLWWTNIENSDFPNKNGDFP